MNIISIGLLSVVVVQFVVGMYRENKATEERNQSIKSAVDAWFNERLEWHKERQMLLDRIQAPSFAEYTNKVVREKKSEQPQEEEKPVEFIS